jgi:hypothetical protein
MTIFALMVPKEIVVMFSNAEDNAAEAVESYQWKYVQLGVICRLYLSALA